MSERDPIETLRALLSEATPGPCRADVETGDLLAPDDDSAPRGYSPLVRMDTPADLRLFAALRNLAPRLLAVVEAAEGVCRNCPGLEAHGTRLGEALDALRADAVEVLRD